MATSPLAETNPSSNNLAGQSQPAPLQQSPGGEQSPLRAT